MEIIPTIFSNHSIIKLKSIINTKLKNSQKRWKLNNALQNNQWIKEEIKMELRKHHEMSENENRAYQNLWDATKPLFLRTFTATNDIKKERRS